MHLGLGQFKLVILLEKGLYVLRLVDLFRVKLTAQRKNGQVIWNKSIFLRQTHVAFQLLDIFQTGYIVFSPIDRLD